MNFLIHDTESAFEYARPFIEEHTQSPVEHAEYLRIYDSQNKFHLKGLALGIICKNGDSFYLKYSEIWRLAGYKTCRFVGAGVAINLEHYNRFITEKHADILFYEKLMKKLYYCPYETFKDNSFNHVQEWDQQLVQVIPFDSKNKFFEKWS